MDLLTKYRPVKSAEFYQRKVLRFIHSSEGTDDLRTLGIPYGQLGFDSPLHFIRCIPSDLCDEYVNDKLFERIDKCLRKGNRVFLTSDDGRIQSAVYKGQKQTGSGQCEAILDGHRSTYPVESIVPYKAFLRKNVGAMLIDGPHKIIGPNVTYEDPKWDAGEAIYYKPAKRWAVIEDRDIVRGKVYCQIKIEKSSLKKEKVVKVPLWELMADSIPYKMPVIPKNNANVKEHSSKTIAAETDKQNSDRATKIAEDEDLINHNKLTRQISKESESKKDISFRKSTSSEGESCTPKETQSPKNRLTSASNANDLVDLLHSPKSLKSQNNYTEAPTIVLRRNTSKVAMRPLTEYFHTKSVSEAIHDDYQSVQLDGPDLKFKSVNNLNAQVSEEEEFTFENYTNSLRRSARNVLAKQLANEARQRTLQQDLKKRKTASLSTDNLKLVSNPVPAFKHTSTLSKQHKSIPAELHMRHKQNPSLSTSANDTSDSEAPPPLPPSLPPHHQVSDPPQTYLKQHPVYERTLSVVETYFVEKDEPPQRNYENSNFHSHHGSFSLSSELSSGSLHESSHQYPLPTEIPKSPMVPLEVSQSPNHHHDHQSMVFPTQYLQHAISIPSFEATTTTLPRTPRTNGTPSKPTRPSTFESSTVDRNTSRYRKNPSATKSKEHLQKVKSVPNMVEHVKVEDTLPRPFTGENIHSAVGKGRGIQTGYHSAYADVSLFSLFYCSNIFDKFLLEEAELDRGMKRDIKAILRNRIVKPLRLSAFCSRESVSHLREAMLSLSSKLNSSFMDAEEFLYLLFENALNLPEFIKYSNGANDFMHQIIVRPKDRSRCQDVQFLFETSLEINSLKLKDVPMPGLILSMPRCNGRLVYYEAIIPTMRLNVTSLVDKGPKKCLCEMAATLECALCYKHYGEVSLAYCQTCQRMADQIHYHIGHSPVLVPKPQKDVTLSLLAVICMKNNSYSTFVKTSEDIFAPWLFFEATPTELPNVLLLDDFGRWLSKLEKEPGRYRELAKRHPYLKRIITESHICIYYAPETVQRSSGFAESFMI